MKLKSSSWYYKLHRMTYENMSYNLCSFFWETVLAVIMFVPNIVWCFIPDQIGKLFGHKRHKDPFFTERWVWAFLNYATVVILYSAVCVFFYPFGLNKTEDNFFKVMGYIVWALVIIVVFCILIHLIFTRRKTLLTDFIKAKKQKICPRIEWEKET